MNTVSVYGLLIVVAWCSFPSLVAAQAQCTGAHANCTYGSDTCCNGTYCQEPIRDPFDYELERVSSTCQPCIEEGHPCSDREECCSNPNVEIRCYPDIDLITRNSPYACLAVCRGVGEECRNNLFGGGYNDCCRGARNNDDGRDLISCLKSNSSGRFTCTKVLGIYKRCGRDEQSNQLTPCESGLSCVERNVVVTPQEFAQQVYNTTNLEVLGGVLSDLQLKKFVCDPIRPPSCIVEGGPCTVNYRGEGNCCSTPTYDIAYCRNETAVSAGSLVYNGVCARCSYTSPRVGDCTSDEQCCPQAGGYCRGIGLAARLHRKCRQCGSTGRFCDDVIKCCSPNDTCVRETINEFVYTTCQPKRSR